MNPGLPSENTVTTTGPTRSLKSNPWFYALLSCFLLTAIFGAKLLGDIDMGFHLKGGQWIVENTNFPSKDTFTYTVNDRDYVDLHWLYQVSLYLFYRSGGYLAISFANIAFVLLVFFITFKRLQETGASLWMDVILLAFALFACELRFQARPEILTWLFMGLMLWILELRVNQGRSPLYLLPVIMLVWVNVEGLFAIGWVLMAIYLVSSYVHSKKIDQKLLRYSGLAVAACLLNPYFFRGMMFPFTLLGTLGTSNILKRNVNEFQSPWTMGSYFTFLPEWTLLAYKIFVFFLFFLVVVTFKKRKLHELLLAASFFYLSTISLRNISLFMIACVPLAAACWKDLQWGRLKKFQSAVFSRPLAAWLFTALMLGIGLRVVNNAYYVSERRLDRFGLGLDNDQQAVKAAQFLVDRHLDGRIINHINLGAWLDWKGPQKTFIDGRLEVMGPGFFTEFINSTASGGLKILLEKYKPDILFFNAQHVSAWLADLRKMPEWRPVYLDETGVIFLRKGYAPEVTEMDDGRLLAQWEVPPTLLKEAATVLQTRPPPAWRCFLEDFYKPSKYSTGINAMGIYYSNSGQFELSEMFFLENIRRTQGRYYETFYNLGGLYFGTKRIEEAKLCIQRLLEKVPHETLARQIRANYMRP
jgi:hypothetical protein